jgi:putative NADPH-quinone reductase
MKVLVISGNPKKSGALAELTAEAARGASENGADVEEVRLAEKDLGYCRFCMKCHEDIDSPVSFCVQKDDLNGILEKVRDADCYILACPASGGHANAIMKTFIERTTWTLGRPTRNILWVKGCPESRIADRRRYAASITTAGVVPTWSRAFCNGSTREMCSHARGMFNAKIVGRLYAGSILKRGVTGSDKVRAHVLGRRLVETARQGSG